MRKLVEELNDIIGEDKWSGDVDTKWEPPEGFFTKSADAIASGLKSASDSYAQAVRRLSFYKNRAGENLPSDEKAKLDNAHSKLKKLYGREDKD